MGAPFRVGASALVAVTLVAASACSSAPSPSASPSPSPSISASPTATASTTATPGPSDTAFPGRNPAMSDAEALARIANPSTGESWFDTPKLIAAPTWAASDSYLGDRSVHWYELGIRDGNTIVCYTDENIQEIFERGPDGSWQWIGAPSASEPVTGGVGVTFGFPDVPLNEHVYYDSMTLPHRFTLPTGEALDVNVNDRGGIASPGYTVKDQPAGTPVDTLGGYTILRYTTPVSFVWSDYYDVPAPEGVTYHDLYYMLRTPYGMYIPLFYTPFTGLGDITWSVATTFTVDQYAYISDLNDISCGVWEKDHNTIVTGIPATEWTVGGTTPLGVNVYVPKASNPLAEPLYDAYVASRDANGQSHDSIGTFLAAPAFVGYVTPDTGQWIVYLNGAYSGRAWC